MAVEPGKQFLEPVGPDDLDFAAFDFGRILGGRRVINKQIEPRRLFSGPSTKYGGRARLFCC